MYWEGKDVYSRWLLFIIVPSSDKWHGRLHPLSVDENVSGEYVKTL